MRVQISGDQLWILTQFAIGTDKVRIEVGKKRFSWPHAEEYRASADKRLHVQQLIHVRGYMHCEGTGDSLFTASPAQKWLRRCRFSVILISCLMHCDPPHISRAKPWF